MAESDVMEPEGLPDEEAWDDEEDGEDGAAPDRGGAAPTPKSKLSIVGNGLAFEREISDALVLSVMSLVLAGEGGTGALVHSGVGALGGVGQGATGGRGAADRRLSLPEFYHQVDPKQYPQKVATIGAYMARYQDRPSFSADDLKSMFRSVNEPPPANLSRDIRVAAGSGWIADEVGTPGQFYVTRTGFDAVDAKFEGAVTRRGAKRRGRKRPSRTDAEANGAVE